MQDPSTREITTDLVIPAARTLTLSGTLAGAPGGTLDLTSLTSLTLGQTRLGSTLYLSELADENDNLILDLTDDAAPDAYGAWEFVDTVEMLDSSDFTVSGTLTGTPTGGTLNLENITLTGGWTFDENLTAPGLVTTGTVKAGTELIIGSTGHAADGYEITLRAQEPEVDTVLLLPSGSEHNGIRLATMTDVTDGDATVNSRISALADDPASEGDLDAANWRAALSVYSKAQTDANLTGAVGNFAGDPSDNTDFAPDEWRTDLNVENAAAADQVASEVPSTATGDIAATDVQAALAELDTEKLSTTAAAATYQPLDDDLTDLADGSLSGNKVGSGIDAANITTGTLDPDRTGSGSGLQILRRNAANTDFEWATINVVGGGDLNVADIDTVAEVNGIIADGDLLTTTSPTTAWADLSSKLASSIFRGRALSDGRTTHRRIQWQPGELGAIMGMPITIYGVIPIPSANPSVRTLITAISDINISSSLQSAQRNHTLHVFFDTNGDLIIKEVGDTFNARRELVYDDFIAAYAAYDYVRFALVFTEGDSTTPPKTWFEGTNILASFDADNYNAFPNWIDGDLDTSYYLAGYQAPAGEMPLVGFALGPWTDSEAASWTSGGPLPTSADFPGSAVNLRAGDGFEGGAHAPDTLTSSGLAITSCIDDGTTIAHAVTDDPFGGLEAGVTYALHIPDFVLNSGSYPQFKIGTANNLTTADNGYPNVTDYAGEQWVTFTPTAAVSNMRVGWRITAATNFSHGGIKLVRVGALIRPYIQPGQALGDQLGRTSGRLIGGTAVTDSDPRSWTIDSTGDLTTASQANLTGGAASTNTTTGDLVTSGGIGIGGAIHAGGAIAPSGNAATWTTGTGTPEGSVTAPVGSIYTRTDGGADTTLYIKESGTGNTGWIAK
jgi:hypothetical protein